jgi:diguanylate cyclase (GGDEF)-like protein
MNGAVLAWSAAAACAAGAAYFWMRGSASAERARRAERRFDLLQNLAPSLTAASAESARVTCARILGRLDALVPSRTGLCFYVEAGKLVLGAKSGDGYVGFLREGAAYEGDSIVDWSRERGQAAIVGPLPAQTPADVDIVDLGREREGREIGPAAGSRDRVWALAAPLAISRGLGLAPDVVGIVYLERLRADPFSGDDMRTVTTVARLGADALARALFADAVRRDSAVDGLTDLMTPAAFRTRLRQEVSVGRDVGLFFIDTDHFKVLNDTCGHAAGDRLLRTLAGTFAKIAASSGGFAGRNGGDEFCIALPARTKDAAVEIAEHTRASIDEKDLGEAIGLPPGAVVKITVSIGVAHHPVDIAAGERQPADRLLEIADAQMYEAKRAGRNRVEFLRAGAASRDAIAPGEGPIPRI